MLGKDAVIHFFPQMPVHHHDQVDNCLFIALHFWASYSHLSIKAQHLKLYSALPKIKLEILDICGW